MPASDIVLYIAEIIGTIAFAVSGAMVAVDKGLDLFGVIFLGVTTALGGGTIRDILIGKIPPSMFYNYYYVLIAFITALIVFIVASFLKRIYVENRKKIEQILNLFDAVGLGVFAVIGTQTGMAAGYDDNPFFCIFLGMTTGVGGGMLRDVLAKQMPYVFVKHIYALAAIGGAFSYYVLVVWCGLDITISAFISMFLIITIRILASHYRWNLPRVTLSNDK